MNNSPSPLDVIKALRGRQGAMGWEGKTGPRGPQGIQGWEGKPGKDGKDGKDSKVPGPRGPKGDKGDPGESADIIDVTPIAQAIVNKHLQEANHDPFILGTKKISEKNIGDGKFIKYDAKSDSLIYSTIRDLADKVGKHLYLSAGIGIPVQSGHSGQFLTTNGADLSWAAGGGSGGSAKLLTPVRVAATTTDNGFFGNSNYNNGTAGVGATLTQSYNGVAPVVDGVTLQIGDRVLVLYVDNPEYERYGIYTVTDLGSVSTPWILTRATDFNSAANILAGSSVFVTEGVMYTGEVFTLQGPGPFLIGTDPLLFQNPIAGPVATGGNGRVIYTDDTGIMTTSNLIYVYPAASSVGIGFNPVGLSPVPALGINMSGINGIGLGIWGANTAGVGNPYFSVHQDGPQTSVEMDLYSNSAATIYGHFQKDASYLTSTLMVGANSGTAYTLESSGTFGCSGNAYLGYSSSSTAVNVYGTVNWQNASVNTFPTSWELQSINTGFPNIHVDGVNNFVGISAGSPHSTLHVSGSFATNTTPASGTYNVIATDQMIFADSTSAAVTINLPSASTIIGRQYVIKDVKGQSGTNNITIVPSSGETIDSASTYTISIPYESVTLVAASSNNWSII